MNRIQLFLAVLISSSVAHSQVIGGRENSESTPKVAEATQLSGGGFVGDVNVMTGEFQASIPLGSVSTPAGLGFSLSLNHSSSFAFSNNQPMTAGIPYGDGWSPNIPTISIETDVFRKYRCSELQNDGGIAPSVSEIRFHGDTVGDEYSGSDEGDLYWFSPMINIPGVASGRAIFKYVDVDDRKCLVFVLNKFESPVEIRYYGNSWTVKLADGTTYIFSTHLANYRAPSNQRVLFYNQSNVIGVGGEENINGDIVTADNYGTFAGSVQNVIEPKQSYSVWYSDLIYNQNTPLQGVRFEYEKFGEFNYFEEFNQSHYQAVRAQVFQTSTNTDYSAYSDIFLKKVLSYVMETPLDIVELDYATDGSLVDNGILLDFGQSNVNRKDSLYNYKTVKEWGNDGINSLGNFDQWHRAKHWAKHTDDTNGGNGTASVNPSNPYLSPTQQYSREDGPLDDEMPFDHGFLESPRILDGSNLYPGDVYEIRTKITRPNGSDYSNGNGTLDIAITTGNLGNHPSNETNNYSIPNWNQSENGFKKQNGIEVYSTFNSAVKWQMGYGQGILNTSNFFVMPNIPSSYDGMNIQIGPGNSDIDFSADTGPIYDLTNPLGGLNLLQAYPFYVNGNRHIKSTANIPHNFGTGHPWGMMIPIYNEIALSDPSFTTAQPSQEVLYETWWKGGVDAFDNNPTKFDEDVILKKVELIRYSKNPYMLVGVKAFKVNGDYSVKPNGDITGRELVAQKLLKYNHIDENLIRNYDYQNGDLLHIEGYKRRIIFLSNVREIPVDIEPNYYAYEYNLPNITDTSKLLTTFLGYRKILDNEALANGATCIDTIPYNALSQYLLYSYTDHLGGITKVDYYPFGGNGESRFSNNYIFNPCNVNIVRGAMGGNNSYTGHAAVQYLAKNDENDIIQNSNYLGSATSNMKVWEYEYDVTSRIFNPKQMKLNDDHFRSQHLFRYESAFGSVRVLSPVLPNGEQTHIDYEYYGHHDPLTIPSKADFLLYGKLKTMKTYDQNDVLHDEKIINYEYTLAFENAYIRPNLLREKLGYDDYYARSYEYEDIYKDELLHLYNVNYIYGNPQTPTVITDSIVTIDEYGEAAYPSIDVPILHGNYSDREQPKFMEFSFYNDLNSLNAAYFFDSYFIKKTSEINKAYDNYLGKNGVISTPFPPIGPNPNPYGGGIVNPVPNDPISDDPLLLTIDESTSQDALSALLSNSPLSEVVLNYTINSSMSQNHIATVLAMQMGISNNICNNFIDKRGKFSSESYNLIINAQPYFSDAIQSHFIQALTARDNYVFPKDLLLKNEYLSDAIALELTNAANKFPEEVFTDVISEQANLSEPTLLAIINCVHLTNNTLVNSLSDQVLNDELWDKILLRPDFTTNTLTQLVESTLAFPSDNTLIDILEYSPAFDNREIERIFAIMNRSVSIEVKEKLFANFPDVGPAIVDNLFIGNPLGQYCNNPIIQGRTYIETRTDYEYYEADYTGKSIGIAHEMLLGHRSAATDPSPYPFMQTTTTASGSEISHQVKSLRLKHEPSWQVFSVQTSSPQHPGAYSREEYFYLYDLQNRYDRYWYNYDLASGDYIVTDADPLNGFFSMDTIGFNTNWATDYIDPYYPYLPQFDGMERTRTYGNRVLAFQKSVISKNSRDEDPLIRSEYYDYDRRWIFNDLPGEIEVVEHDDWGPCPVTNPNPTGPCANFFDCTDCYWFKHISDQQMQALVPLGHCAYRSPTYGWFICPYGTDVNSYAPDAVLEYCNLGVSSNNSPIVDPLVVAMPKALQPADAFAKTLLLRSVTIQLDTLDHSTNQEFAGIKMDGKNQYIAEFELGNYSQTDANNFNAPYEMIYPYDKLTVRTILERNRYLQPALEENQIGLQTKYYYNKSQSLWNTNINCTTPGSGASTNYLSSLNEDIAKPIRITVGYNKLDSLSSTYEYNEISLANKMTSPSGKFMKYEFDDYFRLKNTKENGIRLLNQIEYSNWAHENLSFGDRTKENYVETILYNDNPLLDPLNINHETRKAFIDPLGRNHSVATGYSTDPFTHVEIHSGTVEYDNWGRTTKAYKSFSNDLTTTIAGAPKINLSVNNQLGSTYTFSKTLFENDPKGRALRTSNYGVDVAGIHAVKSSYAIVNNVFASCELNLNLIELELLFDEGSTAAYRFIRTEILDQDNKKTVDYLNAIGQKVASLKYNTNNQRIVTLFVYDSYGNLTKVINPEKQESDYEYNILGQLVKETTIDAGTKRYMYNKQGLVSITLDEQGQFYDPNGNGVPGDPVAGTTDAFYRVYKYDDYGRLIKVGRSIDLPSYSLNQEFGPLHYETTFVGEPNQIETPENFDWTANGRYLDYTYSNVSSQDWLASFGAWAAPIGVGGGGNPSPQVVTIDGLDGFFYPTIIEKETYYGGDVTSNEIGKVMLTNSFDNNGLKIQKTEYTYDNFDNLATQTTTFNPEVNVDLGQASNITSVISYPSYNYRNSLKEERVDVDGNGTIDYHCYMEYDALNRLKSIHGAAGLAATISDATLLVSYEYDDANGLVNKKKHFIDDNTGLSVLANEIDYNYDVRDRLTEIKAGLPNHESMMHYALFYDDQAAQYWNGTTFEFVSNTNNWNGNINGTLMNYGLQEVNISNPVSDYEKPLLYGYTYDKINRLIGADATVGNFLLQSDSLTNAERHSIGDVSVRYDRIGNIQSLHRTIAGPDLFATTPVLPISEIQHWTYNYGGGSNRLNSLTGQSGTVSRAYSYDSNGNLLTDDSKNLNKTIYGRAAYPFELQLVDQTEVTGIDYLYSVNDQRIYKKSVLSIQENTIEEQEDYYLMDGFGKTVAILHRKDDSQGYEESWEYYASGAERECRLVPTSSQAPTANSGNSNVKFKKDQVSFFLYDHLGNTRVTYTPTSFISHPGDPTVAVNKVNTVIDYFPYGKVLREFQNGDKERYLTTQHERDSETGLDYRGARYYDGDVGRFLSLDPKASDYPSLSDYCYVAGNPIIFIDPDGKDFRIYYNDSEGNKQSVQINNIDKQSLQNAITESGNNEFVMQFVEAVQYVGEADRKDVFKKIAKRRKIIAVHLETGRDTQFSTTTIDDDRQLGEDESGIIAWNPLDGNMLLDDGKSPTGEISSSAVGLLHEGGHGLIQLYKPILNYVIIKFIGADEENIVTRKYENKAQKDLNEPVRGDYNNSRGTDVPSVTYHEGTETEK